MLSPATSQVLEVLERVLPAVNATRFIAAGSLVTVLYDWLLTLDDEVELIYPAPWSIVKFLYIFIRISSAVGLGVMNFHLAGFRSTLNDTLLVAVIGPLQILSIAASNFLVMRRVGPLYGNRAIIVYGLHLLYLGSYIATITLSIQSIMPLIPISKFSPTLNMCTTTKFVRPNGAIFFGPLILETTVFILTAYKAYRVGKSVAAETKMPLVLHVFFRDGIVHYAVMLVARVLCILVYFEFPPSLLFVGVFILWTAVATMTTRLVINIRAANQTGRTEAWETAIEEPSPSILPLNSR